MPVLALPMSKTMWKPVTSSGGTVKFGLHNIKAAARAMSLAVKTQLAV
jgi:hypothetical protein